MNGNEGCDDERESKLNHGDNIFKKQWQNERRQVLQAPGLKERKKDEKSNGAKGNEPCSLYTYGNNG